MAKLYLDSGKVDERLFRLRLMAEELGELAAAMADADEVETMDAIGDLLFVVYGTAVKLGLPATEAFDEVARSNLTKDPDVRHAEGVKGKGAGFVPPDMEKVLERWRS